MCKGGFGFPILYPWYDFADEAVAEERPSGTALAFEHAAIDELAGRFSALLVICWKFSSICRIRRQALPSWRPRPAPGCLPVCCPSPPGVFLGSAEDATVSTSATRPAMSTTGRRRASSICFGAGLRCGGASATDVSNSAVPAPVAAGGDASARLAARKKSRIKFTRLSGLLLAIGTFANRRAGAAQTLSAAPAFGQLPVAAREVCSGLFQLTTLAFWLRAGTQLRTLRLGQLPAAIALSWVGGFVVVGAPGGIGVHEALLFQLLAGIAATPALPAIAVAVRVSLMPADRFLFALAFAFQRGAAA